METSCFIQPKNSTVITIIYILIIIADDLIKKKKEFKAYTNKVIYKKIVLIPKKMIKILFSIKKILYCIIKYGVADNIITP